MRCEKCGLKTGGLAQRTESPEEVCSCGGENTSDVSLQDKIRGLLDITPLSLLPLDQVDIADKLNVDLDAVCKTLETMAIEGRTERTKPSPEPMTKDEAAGNELKVSSYDAFDFHLGGMLVCPPKTLCGKEELTDIEQLKKDIIKLIVVNCHLIPELNRHYYDKVMRRLVKVRKKYNDGSYAYRALGEMQDEIEDSFLQTDATKKNSG